MNVLSYAFAIHFPVYGQRANIMAWTFSRNYNPLQECIKSKLAFDPTPSPSPAFQPHPMTPSSTRVQPYAYSTPYFRGASEPRDGDRKNVRFSFFSSILLLFQMKVCYVHRFRYAHCAMVNGVGV